MSGVLKMTKIEIEFVKPNMIVVDRGYFVLEDDGIDNKREQMLYIGLNAADFLPACEVIDEVIKENIGELKVKESDYEIARSGFAQETSEKYTFPLSEYFQLLRNPDRKGSPSITYESASVLGDIAYLLDASTCEVPHNIGVYFLLEKNLKDADKAIDKQEERFFRKIFKFARKDTKKAMEETYNSLKDELSDNEARLYAVAGQRVLFPESRDLYLVAQVSLINIKEQGKAQLEDTKATLIDKLKEFRGPCLSLDAPSIMNQVRGVYDTADELVGKYGDILVPLLQIPIWKTRLFRFDP